MMQLELDSPTQLRQRFKPVQLPARQSCFLIYYDGGFASLAALRAACEDALPGTRMVAVYLDMVSLSETPLPGDNNRPTAGQAILAAATVNAALYGVTIETACMECHARGPAMVELAERYGGATIYLGVVQEELNPFADFVKALAPASVVLVTV